MNLDELERLHTEIVDNEARGNFVAANWLGSDLKEHLAQNFPALLALARDGERYRWALEIGPFGCDLSPYGTEKDEIDAAIDAAMKGRT